MDNKSFKSITRLFPYLEDKKRIDDESVHFISLKEVAANITHIIKTRMEKMGYGESIYITDATAGVGGNVISFGKTFDHVTAIELDELRYEYLVNNINVYELRNISTYHDDCRKILPKVNRQDVVFIDPPWGGSDYKSHENLRLSLSTTSIEELCNSLMDSTKVLSCPKLIVLKLPTNYDLKYLYDTIDSTEIYLHELKKMKLIVIVNTNYFL